MPIPLWFDIAERRNDLPGPLAQAAKQLEMTAWPAPVVKLFLSEMTLAETLAAADDKDATKKRRQVCDANLYGAEFLLSQGRKEEALDLYRFAASDCPNDLIEWSAANAALRVLGATPYLE
jgi:lipoprotein NlpI